MNEFAMLVAAVLMVAGSMVGASLPAQAARTPSVSVTITDRPGTDYCYQAFSVRGLEPGACYELWITGGGYILPRNFTTDARGAHKANPTSVDRELFNKTNTITVGLSEGSVSIVPRVRIANRCPAS